MSSPSHFGRHGCTVPTSPAPPDFHRAPARCRRPACPVRLGGIQGHLGASPSFKFSRDLIKFRIAPYDSRPFRSDARPHAGCVSGQVSEHRYSEISEYQKCSVVNCRLR